MHKTPRIILLTGLPLLALSVWFIQGPKHGLQKNQDKTGIPGNLSDRAEQALDKGDDLLHRVDQSLDAARSKDKAVAELPPDMQEKLKKAERDEAQLNNISEILQEHSERLRDTDEESQRISAARSALLGKDGKNIKTKDDEEKLAKLMKEEQTLAQQRQDIIRNLEDSLKSYTAH